VSRRTPEQLIDELVREAPPVRPIPRLRTAMAAVAVAWALAVAAMAALGAPLLTLASGAAWGEPRFLLVLAGLALVAVGASVAALASAVPGRGRALGVAGGVATAGLGLAAGGGLWAVWGAAGPGPGDDFLASFACMSEAWLLGLLPVLGICLFLSRGLVRHPGLSLGLAVTGAAALGGVVISLACRLSGGLHLLVGHALAPLLIGMLVALPVGWWLRR
jgi:hypothetical protein